MVLRSEMIDTAARMQENIIISDTNIQEQYRMELVAKLCGLGYYVRYEILRTPWEICLERNSERANPVPLHVMERMRESFGAQFGPLPER